jgi:hypothetical protein
MENNELHSEASLEIGRKDGKLSSVKIEMPIWVKEAEDSTMKVHLPLFRITTFADDREDADEAVKEALACFFVCAEKFGRGVDEELKDLGWTAETNESNFVLESDDSLIEELIKTGDRSLVELEELELA